MIDESSGLAAANAVLRGRVAELERERDRLKQDLAYAIDEKWSWRSVVLGKVFLCGYCEHKEPDREDVVDFAKTHDLSCPKHPMRAVEAERDALREQLRVAEAEQERLAYELLALSLDVERAREGRHRAAHASNQWLCDLVRERDELRAENAALAARVGEMAAALAEQKRWVDMFWCWVQNRNLDADAVRSAIQQMGRQLNTALARTPATALARLRAAEGLAAALREYAGTFNEDACYPCDHEAGGIWVDTTYACVQELDALAEAALVAWEAAK